jgi:hypothetical protein
MMGDGINDPAEIHERPFTPAAKFTKFEYT